VTLYDGSYHDVDSNGHVVPDAGRIAFRKAMESGEADAWLEPSCAAEITVPDDFAAVSIMGD